MGYICFKCKKTVGVNVRFLFSHLRRMHNVHSSSSYFECCQEGCHRTFNYSRSFKRHLLQHHVEGEEEEPSQSTHIPERLNFMSDPTPLTSHSQIFEEEDNDAEDYTADDMVWDELEQKTLTDKVALFLSKLRAKSSMTLSTVNFVFQQTSSLVSDIVGALQRQTMTFLQATGQSEIPEARQLNLHFENAAKAFQCLDTEHKQMKYFVQSGYLVQPVEQPLPGVSYTQQRDSQTGTVKQVAVQDTFQRIPLRPLLKLILQSPGTMEKITEWKRKISDSKSLDDTTVLRTSVCPSEPSVPLLLYNDDCEMVNPLGSKTSVHKLGLIYFTLKCLPPECLSSLDSHFLLAVYKADDAKTYGIDAVLKSVVDDINDLGTNGVEVDTAHFKGTLKIWVAQICGDNLGLNSILGYTKSFSGNSVCRWCRVKKPLMRTQTMEDPLLLRNKDGHLSDLVQNGEPQFGTIQKIVVFESVIKFIVRKWDLLGFERHYFACCVIPTTVIDCIDVGSLDDYHPLHVVRSYKEGDSNYYVSMRYRLF
ncbi:uncharacterized protein [Garra rufa]|uniref:uncharacterized protein n=1 Tax=Garra rufa TaxID=137080 RepID=UPI003CCE6A5F